MSDVSWKNQAEAFLAQPRIAVVGVSRKPGTANGIMKALRQRGHHVFAVNPNATEVDGVPCYPSLQAIPDGVGAAVIVTRPEVSEAVARECVAAGVDHVWMHHNPLFGAGGSSVSPAGADYCREHGVNVIVDGCPLMVGQGADFGHRCMRWILGLTGRMPRD